MDKTKKINLAGILFQIDEEAFLILRSYLNALDNRLKNTPGGTETLEDIEARIAEIFQTLKEAGGIISREDVEAVIKIIGNPEEFEQPGFTAEKTSSRPVRRRLYRDTGDAVIGGVCSGIGAYLNTDAVWIRLLFVIFTLSFGIAFFIYLGLWIALPVAVTEIQKRELFGENYYERMRSGRKNNSGRLAGAINSVFIALGKLINIAFRIILIFLGITMVMAGFSMLITFIMIFYLKIPGIFFAGHVENAVFYMPDFLNVILNESLTPWVMVLVSLSVILPLIVLVYWGLKIIFRFRANELAVSLTAFVMWVVSVSALVLILFSQGINFAERGFSTERIITEHAPDTLFVKTGRKIADMNFDTEINIPGDNYSLFMLKAENRLFSKPQIEIGGSDEGIFNITIDKIMHGKSRREAVEKAEGLLFNYHLSGDTLYIDQYYEIPSEFRWSGSFIEVTLHLPDKTIIWIDKDAETLFSDYQPGDIDAWELGDKYWIWKDDRLTESVNEIR